MTQRPHEPLAPLFCAGIHSFPPFFLHLQQLASSQTYLLQPWHLGPALAKLCQLLPSPFNLSPAPATSLALTPPAPHQHHAHPSHRPRNCTESSPNHTIRRWIRGRGRLLSSRGAGSRSHPPHRLPGSGASPARITGFPDNTETRGLAERDGCLY